MPQDLPNSQYIFLAVAALNTWGRSWTRASPIWSIIGRWNLLFLTVLSSKKLKSPQFGISIIYRLLATCWYLSRVCALSGSRGIAQYIVWTHLFILHINQPAYSVMERNVIYVPNIDHAIAYKWGLTIISVKCSKTQNLELCKGKDRSTCLPDLVALYRCISKVRNLSDAIFVCL